MRVHEQDARKFIFELGVALFLHLALNFKISKFHLKFGSMRYLLLEVVKLISTIHEDED
jgi:hypothetical protein